MLLRAKVCRVVAGRITVARPSTDFWLVKIRKIQAFVLLLPLKGSAVLLLARTGWGKSLISKGLRYATLKDPDTPRKSRHITVIVSGLEHEQADEINEKAGSNIAIFYDKTKADDKHLGRPSLIPKEIILHPALIPQQLLGTREAL
jgi:hypothetical protein